MSESRRKRKEKQDDWLDALTALHMNVAQSEKAKELRDSLNSFLKEYSGMLKEEELSRMADNPEAYRQNIISSTEQWLRDIEHNTGITPESIKVETTSDIHTKASKYCTTHPIKDTSRLSSHTERYSHTRFPHQPPQHAILLTVSMRSWHASRFEIISWHIFCHIIMQLIML